MPRKKFIIQSEEQSKIAWNWINKQSLNKAEFEKLADYQFTEINQWCEENLNSKQWTRLKGAIRAHKLRRSDKKPIRVDLNTKAHLILKELSLSYGVTISGLIVMKLEADWQELPEEPVSD